MKKKIVVKVCEKIVALYLCGFFFFLVRGNIACVFFFAMLYFCVFCVLWCM